MCLAVPGRVERLTADATGVTLGEVSFGGVRKTVCLDYVPDPRPGQWVLVHAGFAIAVVDEDEARRTLALLEAVAGDPPVPPPRRDAVR